MTVKKRMVADYEKILALRLKNKSSSEIARELGYNKGTLLIFMREMGMPKFQKLGDDRFGQKIDDSDEKYKLPVGEFRPNLLLIKKWNCDLQLV